VRNNTLGARAWGFMTEPERLNVMFSRARYRQVVIGCSAHIERHVEDAEWLQGVWKAYQEQAKDETCARILPAAKVLRG
jgi:superfamily I DNA and/or RNA helicase